MKNKVTIVLPISRKEYLAQVFAYLELMDCDNGRTNLIAIVDGDNDLFIDARNRVEMSKFAERLCVQYVDNTGFDKNEIHDRRLRIADIHNSIKPYIGECDYIFGVEDDTLIPKNALKKLLYDYSLYPHAGFIEGVELGRWGTYYVGAWKVDDVYDASEINSVMPPENPIGLQEIDGGGFYCFMTPREAYMSHIFQTYQNNSLGPDVDYGFGLREMGFSNFIDWDIRCIHRNMSNSISWPKDTPEKVTFKKINEKWERVIK